MAIKGLTDQPRLPECGKIKIGGLGEEDSCQRLGADHGKQRAGSEHREPDQTKTWG